MADDCVKCRYNTCTARKRRKSYIDSDRERPKLMGESYKWHISFLRTNGVDRECFIGLYLVASGFTDRPTMIYAIYPGYYSGPNVALELPIPTYLQ